MATVIDLKTRTSKAVDHGEVLKFLYTVRSESKHVSINDQRRRVSYVLAAYADAEGFEYRKSFESYDKPKVPNQGTHKELNALAIQY
jgi:hypothetical protein